MKTGLQQYWTALNRIFTADDLETGVIGYFKDTLTTLLEDVLYPQSGLFQSVTLAGDGNDKFKLSSYQDPTAVAGGRIVVGSEDASVLVGIQFENAVGIDYHAAIGRSWLPVGVEVSPKDGMPKIKFLKETIGSDGVAPDAVVDNLDGTLTLTVDAATEAAVSNAGRTILALKAVLDKGATSEALAWQECTVVWVGGNNKITTVDTPAGAGYFGQTVPSTTASDYLVVLRGPIVKRNTDLSLDSSLAYLGTVNGVGAGGPPVAFDTSGQIVFGTGGISNLNHITRTENVPPNRLKIDVKAIAAEEGSAISQIRVSGWDGVGGAKTVFDVDELGNVAIQGDLTVEGTTIQENLVTINASEIIADNLTLGDADGDTHLVKGTWTHKNAAETQTWFVVDSATGHVGIRAAADATYPLNVGTGGIKSGGDVIPGTTGLTLGDPVAGYWHSVYITTGAFHNEGDETQQIGFRAFKCEMEIDSALPRLWFRDSNASHALEKNFSIEIEPEQTMSFVGYHSDKSTKYAWLQAVKANDGYQIENIATQCTGILSLNADTTVSIDAGSANVVIQAGGIVSITAAVECGDKFKVSDVAGEGVNGNFSPSAVQTYALGNWSFSADTGYRWAGVFSADFFAVKEGGMPGYGWRNHTAAADEKHWTFYIDAGNDLVLETRTDNPPGAGTGVSVLKITRGAGTAVTQIDIYRPTYMGATLYTQTVSPVTQHNYYVGSYGGEFLEVSAKDIVASHTAPRLIMRETDQIVTGVDRENWGIIATGGDLAIGAYDSARTSMTEAMHIYRGAGNSFAIDSIKFPAYIRSAAASETDPHTVIGLSGATFYHDLFSYETGLGANEGRWRFTTTNDGNGHFIFQAVDNNQVGGWNPANVFDVLRGSGSTVTQFRFYCDVSPDSDGNVDLGVISPSNNRLCNAYISGNVEAALLRASGDDGVGKAGFVTYTGTTSAINDVADGTIRLAVAAKNSGWLKIRVATDIRYIPYFSAT